MSFSRLVRNGGRALVSGVGRKFFGIRPSRPWISYDAQAVIAKRLARPGKVLEFGSGKSTSWFARRAESVVAIEDDDKWFEAVVRELAPYPNVELKFADSRQDYIEAVPDMPYDFIMIDGSWRHDCAKFAIAHLAAGGLIYLDNSDMQPGPLAGDIPAARKLLLEFAEANGLGICEFTDFAPTQFHVQQGLLIGA